MRSRRFEEIMRKVHLNGNTELDPEDRLSKIRTYLDHLRKHSLNALPGKQTNNWWSYGKHSLNQCIRGKPIRFGYKVWCTNLRLGYLIDFEVYQGPQNSYRSDFGLDGSVLLKFADTLPNDGCNSLPFHACADNYILSFKVMEEFTKREIGLTATIRSGRIKDCSVKSTSVIKKKKGVHTTSARTKGVY